jgi:hypothetical protein
MPTETLEPRSFIDCIKARNAAASIKGPVGVVGGFIEEVESDSEERDIWGIATTNAVDESEEVVLPEGADTGYIDKTRILYVDHRYDMGSVLGKIRVLKPMIANGVHTGWDFRAKILTKANPAFGESVFDTIQEMGTIGVSIGFDALDWGSPTPEESKRFPMARSIVRKWRFLEISLTAMPCNVTCYAQAVTPVAAKSRTRIEDVIRAGSVNTMYTHALGIDSREIKRLQLPMKRLRLC